MSAIRRRWRDDWAKVKSKRAELDRAYDRFAGEFGHIPFFDNEIICSCGKKGCLETEVSGIAIEDKMRHMIERGRGGVMVNNASVLGWRAQTEQAHYAAAKAGVMALTRCAAVEAAPHGIRVNAVAPSLAMHPFLAKVTTDELLDELTQREAFGRYAEPWEVANVMVFLASDYSSYMTGEVVPVSSQRA